MAGRTYLYAISLGAHALLGAALFAVPAEVRHEIIAISMSETSKPKPPPPPEPPPPLPDPPKAAAQPVHAKSPAPKAEEAAPVTQGASTEAIPDFGLSLSNGDGVGGLAIPAARAAAPAPVTRTTKTLSRAARAPVDDCADPPAKPKALSRQTPEYNAQARAAGITGKVRVEITVDEQGHITLVRVLQGLGYGLDEAAVAAARAMTFEPGSRCGKPVSATFKVSFNFSPGTP